MAAIYKWKVSEPPTGPYRSFQKRGWPSAYYKDADESCCARVICDDDYTPARARGEEQHKALTVMIADHSTAPRWKWRKVKRTFNNLSEVKEWLEAFIKRGENFLPRSMQ
jgi:hypothetical protein